MNTYVCISLEHEAQCIHADNRLFYTIHLAAAAARLQEAPPDEQLDDVNSDGGCTFLLQLRENQERTFPCPKDLRNHREAQFHLKLNLA